MSRPSPISRSRRLTLAGCLLGCAVLGFTAGLTPAAPSETASPAASSHWAYQAPVKADLPAVQRPEWARNPIDRFVLARLEAAGLEPAAEADRRTLIRRVTLDLTGLPPTPEEVRAFLEDGGENAYERLVDRLLASPAYGEHMARFWLDAARYGDTHGLHLDNYREMWPYRDWVINAFNANLRYDEFIVKQLAGDLLPEPTLDDLIATGFNRAHVTTNEGGSIEEEVYVRNVTDRVETFGTVMLGQTVGCAACHDHKFDPISMRDFYSLFAFFNSIDGNEMDGNVKDHAPVARVPNDEQATQLKELDGRLAEARAAAAARREAGEPAFTAWLNWQAERVGAGQGVEIAGEPAGLAHHWPLDESGEATEAVDAAGKVTGKLTGPAGWVAGKHGNAFQVAADSYIDLGAETGNWKLTDSFSYGAWIKTPGNVVGSPISKMDDAKFHRGWDIFIENRRVSAHLIQSWPQYAIKVTTKQDVLKPDEWHHVMVVYDGSSKAAGLKVYVDGKAAEVDVSVDSLYPWGERKYEILTPASLRIGRRTDGSPFTGGAVDDVRLYTRALTADEVQAVGRLHEIAALAAKPADARTAEEIDTLRRYYLVEHDEQYREASGRTASLEAEKRTLEATLPTTLVWRERKEPRPAYMLNRGQYDSRGDQVTRSVPVALGEWDESFPADRLGLARWLTSGRHPLAARVAVNRFWQQAFGTGLVKTAEDLGTQGDSPTHPQLLDYLAVDFVESDWDVKRLMRLMVTSAAYRQSSTVTPRKLELDPANRLLSRGPRYRLDAEMLRDQALALGGLLNPAVGGPSVKPPQPEGLWEAVGYPASDTVKFKQDQGDKTYRRGLYTFWKRTAAPPQMTTFDAPSRESCLVRRERTNTPLQALLLMNEQQQVESARAMAQRGLREVAALGESDNAAARRAAWLFELAVARPPDETELAELLSLYRSQLGVYRADPDAARRLIATGDTEPDASLDPAELAAWTMLCNLILNLDEVLTKG